MEDASASLLIVRAVDLCCVLHVCRNSIGCGAITLGLSATFSWYFKALPRQISTVFYNRLFHHYARKVGGYLWMSLWIFLVVVTFLYSGSYKSIFLCHDSLHSGRLSGCKRARRIEAFHAHHARPQGRALHFAAELYRLGASFLFHLWNLDDSVCRTLYAADHSRILL